MQFGTWLGVLRAEEAKDGVDHYELACYADKLTPYVRGHLADALGTLRGVDDLIPEFSSEQELRGFWEDSRDEYIRKIRETLDHVGAALTAVGCTDKQLEFAVEKLDENEIEVELPKPPVRVCAMCEKEVSGFAAESLTFPTEFFLCSEECEDRHEGVETVQITVSDVVKVVSVGDKK